MFSRRLFIIILPIAFLVLSLVVLIQNKQRLTNSGCCKDINYSGEVDPNGRVALFEGKQVTLPDVVFEDKTSSVLGVSNQERWIEVDLSEQKLKAWEGDSLFLETAVSTGLPWWPTPPGEYRIWLKLRATKMEGGSGKYYYNLPNVPYVMFFENDNIPGWRGYGLHGTYWHNDFGRPHSHGCVNLPTDIAQKLYYWTSPVMPEGKSSVRASEQNPGTRIVIHQ
jgi:lipoprotein-anchoring transpeptidase ErfK/SrfK